MKVQTEAGLKAALTFLEQGDPVEAQRILAGLFEHDLDCRELNYTNRCCTFWVETHSRLNRITDEYEHGARLLSEWKSFQNFLKKEISKEKYIYEPALYSVKRGFFLSSLHFYENLMIKAEREQQRKAEILKNQGICYKKLGDFDNARACLSEANDISPNQAGVLAELADCYSLCGEDRFAKVLFREAFFLDPESIDLDFLDSEIVKCLITETEKKGYSGRIMQHWIPVYGVLGGIFNIKRELTSQEVVRLKQNIYKMENEYKNPSCDTDVLVPALLNCYFWLIDNYVQTHENVQRINEILLKIKILDPSIYEKYVR